MSHWSPIKYMGFWDVPRIFITHYREETYLFDCPFIEDLDDESDSYKVYILPPQAVEDLPKDWTTLHERATCYLGEVPVASVRFDATRRKTVRTTILDEVAARKTAS